MIILFVEDQRAALQFYQQLLEAQPELDVPGMTEFRLPDGGLLGLMPESGIRRLLPPLPDDSAHLGPRAELYLQVDQPRVWLERALAAGARLLAQPEPRDWGDTVAYCMDPWGYLLAFASVTPPRQIRE